MEDVLLMYIDLDRLMEAVKLPRSESLVVQMLMDGYSVNDIAEVIGATRSAPIVYFNRAVKKLIAEYNRQWAMWHGDVKAKDNPRYCL